MSNSASATQSKAQTRQPQPLVVHRTAQGFTQRELADAAGVAARTVAGIEAGDRQPHLATQRALAAALGFEDVGELFS